MNSGFILLSAKEKRNSTVLVISITRSHLHHTDFFLPMYLLYLFHSLLPVWQKSWLPYFWLPFALPTPKQIERSGKMANDEFYHFTPHNIVEYIIGYLWLTTFWDSLLSALIFCSSCLLRSASFLFASSSAFRRSRNFLTLSDSFFAFGSFFAAATYDNEKFQWSEWAQSNVHRTVQLWCTKYVSRKKFRPSHAWPSNQFQRFDWNSGWYNQGCRVILIFA